MLEAYFLSIILGTVLIWYSGKNLVQTVDLICETKKIGKAFMGTVLLGGITSLPEISTTMIAASLGDPEMAASNLIGGVSMQTSMLAVADALLLKKALTFIAPNPALLMGGVLLIIQISYVICCMALGETLHLFQVGLFATGSFVIYITNLYILRSYEKKERWVPTDFPFTPTKERLREAQPAKAEKSPYIKLLLYSLLVFAGGSTVSFSAHQISELTFLSSGFLGATFVAFATSLPELSTTLASVHLGLYTLGISNIFGSNLLMVGLIFFADIFYRDGLLLNHTGNSTLFLAGLGIVVTAVYLWGLLERRNSTILGMGIDSFMVLTIHITGLFLLYLWN